MGPLLSTFRPRWITDLSIKEDFEPFLPQPAIGEFLVGDHRAEFLAAHAGLPDLARHLEIDTSPLPAERDRDYYFGGPRGEVVYWASGLEDLRDIRIRRGSGWRP